MNAFLTLHQGDAVILLNYFNALSFTAAGEKTVVLVATDTYMTVDESIEEIEAMIREKAVWAR